MRRFRVRLVRVAVALATALVLAPAFAADATGTWLLDVTTPAGTGTPTVTLAQQGETLTGEYRGQLGVAPITGTVKGDALDFSFTSSGMMGSVTVSYIGTINGDEVSGKVKLGDLGEGTFTGKRTAP